MRNKSLREARSSFCEHARRYTAGKTLAEVWAKCPYGSWLRFWLEFYRQVDNIGVLLAQKDCWVSVWSAEEGLNGDGGTRATQRKAARVIREHFSYTGKQLKQF